MMMIESSDDDDDDSDGDYENDGDDDNDDNDEDDEHYNDISVVDKDYVNADAIDDDITTIVI